MAQWRLPGVKARPPANGTRWGGRREGAGRKPKGPPLVAHATRAATSPKVPMHVTLRLKAGLPRLRQRRGYQIAQRALRVANRFDGARICEISIQHNHLHLLVEASKRDALTRTVRSFAISLAKNVNRRFMRRGAVVDDRYHVVMLHTPAQVRAALAYVLCNWRRHGEDLRLPGPRRMTDRYSSGPYFNGWDTAPPPVLPFPDDGPLPLRPPASWLLRAGWKVHGLISPWERPAAKASRL